MFVSFVPNVLQAFKLAAISAARSLTKELARKDKAKENCGFHKRKDKQKVRLWEFVNQAETEVIRKQVRERMAFSIFRTV